MEQNAYVRFEWVIRYLLRNKANFNIIEGVLHYYERILLRPDKTIIDRTLNGKPYDGIKKVYLIRSTQKVTLLRYVSRRPVCLRRTYQCHHDTKSV